MKRLLVLVALLAISLQTAYAAIIVSLPGITPAPGQPGVFNWNYRAELQPDQTVEVGDFFTIYDFPDITAASVSFGANPALPGGLTFTTTVQTPGITPAGTSPTDTGLPNVTVMLTGGGPIIPPTPNPATPDIRAPIDLGILTIQSTKNIPNPTFSD